ncbi:MAG: GxxExxY protein [Verrucomicrobiota bacterium]
MNENELGKIIVDCVFKVHTTLGPGLLESVYEIALAHELTKRSLTAERQCAVPITYDDTTFDQGFRADIIVNDLAIIEIKSIEKVNPVHKKQLLTYLKLTNKRLGFLINFNSALIKNGITRVANGVEDWTSQKS